MRISFLTPPHPDRAVKPPHMDLHELAPAPLQRPTNSSLRLKLSYGSSRLDERSRLAEWCTFLWMAEIGQLPAILGECKDYNLYCETIRSWRDNLLEKMAEFIGHLTTAVPGHFQRDFWRTLLLLFTVLSWPVSPESLIGLNLSKLILWFDLWGSLPK